MGTAASGFASLTGPSPFRRYSVLSVTTSERFPFLSAEWVQAAKRIRDEYTGSAPAVPVVRMNQVITDMPFGEPVLHAHLDSSSGQVELDHGHLPDADVTVTVDYATARALFVEQDQQAAMAAFLAGKIRVQGDLTKLMALQAGGVTIDDSARELAGRIQSITSS